MEHEKKKKNCSETFDSVLLCSHHFDLGRESEFANAGFWFREWSMESYSGCLLFTFCLLQFQAFFRHCGIVESVQAKLALYFPPKIFNKIFAVQ